MQRTRPTLRSQPCETAGDVPPTQRTRTHPLPREQFCELLCSFITANRNVSKYPTIFTELQLNILASGEPTLSRWLFSALQNNWKRIIEYNETLR
jgi:hypothetical protein